MHQYQAYVAYRWLGLTWSWPHNGSDLVCLLHMACVLLGWFSCTMSFCLTFMPLPAISWAILVPPNFPSPHWEAQLGLTFAVSMGWLWFGDPDHFPWCHMYTNIHQSPWCLSDLLSQVFLWGYGGATYVLWVSGDESASLCHLYGTGMSLVVAIVWFYYYTMHPWHPIFWLYCYCCSCNKDRRIISSIFFLIIFSLVGL